MAANSITTLIMTEKVITAAVPNTRCHVLRSTAVAMVVTRTKPRKNLVAPTRIVVSRSGGVGVEVGTGLQVPR